MPRGTRREVYIYARLPDAPTPPDPPDPAATRRRARGQAATPPPPAADASPWRPTWIKAELFRDSRWVTLLSTSWFATALETCKRWAPACGERVPLGVSLALKVYHRFFNLVDRINRKIAAMGMGMARCKLRWERQCYIGWELPAISQCVFVLFQCLYPEMADLRREKRFFGLDRWLQYKSAEVLYKHGLDLDKEELGSPNTRAEQGLHPAGVPKRRRLDRAPPTPLPPRNCVKHTMVNIYKDPKALPKAYQSNRPSEWWQSGGRCKACQDLAERCGDVEHMYEGERDRKKAGHERLMPTTLPDHWQHTKAGRPVPRVRTACKECSKTDEPCWLCPGCFDEPRCWDHECRRPFSHKVTVG